MYVIGGSTYNNAFAKIMVDYSSDVMVYLTKVLLRKYIFSIFCREDDMGI